MSPRILQLTGMLMLLPLCSACSQSNPLNLQAVSGTVTLDAKPLDNGTIQFVPAETTNGLLSGALIVHGAFYIPSEKGIPPGKYTVRITSVAPSANVSSGPPGSESTKPAQERIPPKYNAQSQLTATVTAGSANTFSFDLTTR